MKRSASEDLVGVHLSHFSFATAKEKGYRTRWKVRRIGKVSKPHGIWYHTRIIESSVVVVSCCVVSSRLAAQADPKHNKGYVGRRFVSMRFSPLVVIQRNQYASISFPLLQRCLVFCALLGLSQRFDRSEPPKFSCNDGKVVISPREQGFSRPFHFPQVTLNGLNGLY